MNSNTKSVAGHIFYENENRNFHMYMSNTNGRLCITVDHEDPTDFEKSFVIISLDDFGDFLQSCIDGKKTIINEFECIFRDAKHPSYVYFENGSLFLYDAGQLYDTVTETGKIRKKQGVMHEYKEFDVQTFKVFGEHVIRLRNDIAKNMSLKNSKEVKIFEKYEKETKKIEENLNLL